MRRFGNEGDGGKTVCNAQATLDRHANDCVIVSVGSNGDVSFEEEMRALRPSCAFHIYDPFLTAEQEARIPAWAQYFNEPFNATTGRRRYAGRHVAILKIDCEGCEFHSMAGWLESTCTDLILPEVHGCLNLPESPNPMSVEQRMRRSHEVMSTMERHGYRVYASEVNLLARTPTCVEYGLMRTTPCA